MDMQKTGMGFRCMGIIEVLGFRFRVSSRIWVLGFIQVLGLGFRPDLGFRVSSRFRV